MNEPQPYPTIWTNFTIIVLYKRHKGIHVINLYKVFYKKNILNSILRGMHINDKL